MNDDITCQYQLDFLNKTLGSLSNNSKALIIYHISPFPQFFSNKTEFYWFDNFKKKIEKIYLEHKDKIMLNINSHVHYSSFGVRKNEETNEYFMNTVMFPSLSPVYGNNPGFGYILLQDHKEIKDINKYYFDLNKTLDDTGKFPRNDSSLDFNSLWNITYSYKDDFGYSKFDSFDFYDFVMRRFTNIDNFSPNFIDFLQECLMMDVNER